ncbi:MAG: mitochondrial import inner membrane translocase subunit tim21 [Cirrosporium novae-zelandiae]|nr:MAG: mitochondrial import inner membrane translocase subunit tim21 [Cirrosporium novae-zelandiae]
MFAPGNKVTTYNRVSDRVKADERCQELLGRGSQIRTHGEPTWNKWAMDRPIASTVTEDPDGTKHLLMHFYAEGPLNSGTVRLHMIKKPGGEYEYKYLCLDVKGHERIYLENADAKKRETIKSPMAKLTKILGF